MFVIELGLTPFFHFFESGRIVVLFVDGLKLLDPVVICRVDELPTFGMVCLIFVRVDKCLTILYNDTGRILWLLANRFTRLDLRYLHFEHLLQLRKLWSPIVALRLLRRGLSGREKQVIEVMSSFQLVIHWDDNHIGCSIFFFCRRPVTVVLLIHLIKNNCIH